MNCPSRTDEDLLLNPGWNQSPPRFAADLTTRQDLNGIANSRELRDADGLCSGPQSLRRCELEERNFQQKEKQPLVMGEGVKGPLRGPYTRTIEHVSYEYRAGLKTTSSIISWAKWLFSVMCTSALISFASGNYTPTFQFPRGNANHRLSSRATCENGKAQPNYDLPFHVGGLFIILFVSSTGCAFPILVLKFPRLRIPPSFLFAAKHFGTGVLIATAFVHLLPTAFLSLSNPCLSSFWTDDYTAMPGAIMLASIFFVTIIEMVFSPAQHMCGGNEGVAAVSRRTGGPSKEMEQAIPQETTMRRTYSDSNMPVREMGPLRGRVTSISRTLSRYRGDSQRLDAIEAAGSEQETPIEASKHESDESVLEEDPESNQHNHVLTPEQVHKKAIMQCFLLEMGILFHSIFIGMSLSVAVGNDFVVLLIAIIFHQTFEGLALGVRIADIKWPARAWQPWLMAFAYGCTTPLGQAIGIATHTLYSPNSEIGLLVVGIMNAVSAGFLVFASLVELMSEDFLSDASWQILTGKKRVVACVLVFFGAFLMSLVGAWA
ncbi:Zip-domain-containing protein [Cucurbitaria berberidis CBS 394.84]|uniref:Zip-domain-containing protein n=1 Tax=Cucurbitaria berberidis CBS 394.84 TaxID=1168544 RepID=A0A9P4GAA2_9PLEO|nr:Zip-domain-containing protein [Cucurbitaria berberidis CBS 394.84]KAF1841570.1 Zip-domain-containing protein [Cucurbitaria berberidis CBS 394.84]